MERREKRRKKLRRSGIISISAFLVCGLLFFGACLSKMESKKEGTSKTAAVEKKADQTKKKEKEKKVFVKVIDPNTKAVIHTFTPKEMGYGKDNEKFKQEVINWARSAARGTDTTPGYDKRNTPDRIDANGAVVKGSPRVILEEKELAEKVLKASANGGNVILPLYETESGYKPEDVAHLGEAVVASYTTKFNSRVAGRTKNIELSAMAIDNVILGNGDYFSFNTSVGPSDEAHGYQPAEEAVNGKLVMGIGGGICQTSSTLFNAVDKVGVQYVEKKHHSVSVGYVPKGRDATVSYGGSDFRFVNTTGVPLLIKSIVGNGTLTIEIRTSNQYKDTVKKAI
ncbi:VanW family protein [Mesobacillus zeae]|uniref:Vancomycin resistance protein n=1 Tax=Mesobacillus zeae TaxID=1917180 RepID=A0A398AUQ8_9BACI|nr:VanW family protein [Mesobacillus zeae]RID81459.1 hypothetical protein D1970_21800 [Mesobacillus zeae]